MKLPKYKCKIVRDGSCSIKCNDSESANEIFSYLMKDLPHEEMWAIYVNNKNNVYAVEMIARGGLTGLSVTTKEVFRGAIISGAYGIILGHNHPSGDCMPSPEDIYFTRHIMAASKIIDIEFLDHLVIGLNNNFKSCMV